MHCLLQDVDGRQMLLDYAAGRLTPEARVQLDLHASACADCAAFIHAQQEIWTAMDGWTPVEAATNFDSRLFAQLRREEVQGRRSPLRRVWAWNRAIPAIAACAALFVILLFHPPATWRPAVDDSKASVDKVDVEQVERTLEDLDMLDQFRPRV